MRGYHLVYWCFFRDRGVLFSQPENKTGFFGLFRMCRRWMKRGNVGWGWEKAVFILADWSSLCFPGYPRSDRLATAIRISGQESLRLNHKSNPCMLAFCNAWHLNCWYFAFFTWVFLSSWVSFYFPPVSWNNPVSCWCSHTGSCMSGCLHRSVKRTTIIQILSIVLNVMILFGLFRQKPAKPGDAASLPVQKNDHQGIWSPGRDNQSFEGGNCLFE